LGKGILIKIKSGYALQSDNDIKKIGYYLLTSTMSIFLPVIFTRGYCLFFAFLNYLNVVFKISGMIPEKKFPPKNRGEHLYGWVSKYREINFPTQYYI